MRFTTGGTTRVIGVGVLVLSLALTGCGGKKKNKKHKSGSGSSHSRTIGGATGGSSSKGKGAGSLSGAQDAKAILPPLDTMPTALRNVSTKPYSRAKAPSVCKDPGGKCKGAVANGQVGYRSNNKGESASYDLIVYKNGTAAERAFHAWKSYAENNHRELKVLDGPPQGNASITYGYTDPAMKTSQRIVILQGNFVATLDVRDNSGQANASKDLQVLSEVYATRMLQATQDETPSATAANITV
ncbi:hypothetical protein [Streptomyces sp. MZ04]|uniref:hypothetical protein n=1 Tax=Streptomyces sp. MZ04 TaxID=2559236 RepID=UPI00107EC885|nr:hypothetical protein [Streptomyces sp. MZ04]TGB15008.1 hypothetical protein E2651_03900 [Streptomyces sp. MZ04]